MTRIITHNTAQCTISRRSEKLSMMRRVRYMTQAAKLAQQMPMVTLTTKSAQVLPQLTQPWPYSSPTCHSTIKDTMEGREPTKNTKLRRTGLVHMTSLRMAR